MTEIKDKEINPDQNETTEQLDSRNEVGTSKTDEIPSEEEDEEEDEYVVETIITHRQKKKVKEYLIKWLNYSHEDNTWEPEDNIVDKELLKKYWEKVESEKTKPKESADKKPETKTASSNKRKFREEEPRSPPMELVLDQNYPPKTMEDWESHVEDVITLERLSGSKVVVYLKWKNDVFTSHPVEEAHQKIPQLMLKFYQDHLDFDFE